MLARRGSAGSHCRAEGGDRALSLAACHPDDGWSLPWSGEQLGCWRTCLAESRGQMGGGREVLWVGQAGSPVDPLVWKGALLALLAAWPWLHLVLKRLQSRENVKAQHPSLVSALGCTLLFCLSLCLFCWWLTVNPRRHTLPVNVSVCVFQT